MTLVESVAHRLEELTPVGARCLVAVSGGPDSMALWDLLQLGQEIHRRELVMGHVDHGIHNESRVVAELVERGARSEERGARGGDSQFFIRRLSLGSETSETSARKARRIALREMATESGAQFVILGHHADDQVETILLRVLRGSGPAGLAGMAPRRGIWIRPLLGFRRAELADHLAARGMVAWNDPANTDPRHLRSWLRAETLPALQKRLPDVSEQLLSLGRHASEARRAWDEVPAALVDLSLQHEKCGISVAALPLKGYSSPLRHLLLGTLGRRFGFLLGARRLRAVDRLLFHSIEGGTVDLAAGFEAELAFGRLTLRQRDSDQPEPVEPLELMSGVVVGSHLLTVQSGMAGVFGREGWSTWLVPGRYLVRTWRRGDKMRPLGGRGTRPVSVLLKEAQIAPSRRRDWPVVVDQHDATIAWVPGICRAEGMVPEPGANGIHVECRDR